MPNREHKVQLVNNVRDWKSLLRGKRLIRDTNVDDAKTSWNQTLWVDTHKMSFFNSKDVPISNQRDSIQVLHSTRVNHFDDTSACSVKNSDDDFIKRLNNLLIIFKQTIFNLRKLPKEKFEARVMHFFEQQKPNRAIYEQKWKDMLEAKQRKKAKTKKNLEEDVAMIQNIIVDLEQSGAMEIGQEMDASILDLVAKEPIHETNQVVHSHEVTSTQQEIVVYSTSSSNPKEVAPINYVDPIVVTEERILEMLTQALLKKKEETQQKLKVFAKQ